MITHSVLAQSFLTLYCGWGCALYLAHFHSGLSSWVLSSALTGSDAILDLVSSVGLGRIGVSFLFPPFALLGCSFIYLQGG